MEIGVPKPPFRTAWQYRKHLLKYATKAALRTRFHRMSNMERLTHSLRLSGYLGGGVRALELFGMFGLWHTADYAPICEHIDLWEVDPGYAFYAQRISEKVNVVCGDSIEAVRHGDDRLAEYELIVVDNPFGGCFGRGYCEHFDIFPEVTRYFKRGGIGIVVLNFMSEIEFHSDAKRKAAHAGRRQEFYLCEGSRVLVPQALEAYRERARVQGVKLIAHCLMPRNLTVSYLALVFQT